ncbi:NAD(P)-dependent oxidoreductase [Mucilaginibacter arboris]|uniref:NAD(P)H-binding protein n=1 Tax=Mucilaginibacter arboris TaxID=2682090 RepID=A0A7K1SXQ9_9SPHI|nr:NAD(P)-dependent oxidoreductase [Mucilaginibacter arboris]MVN21800.1 NAD(P)H-binding protein [Mucilaginibacter arboris]
MKIALIGASGFVGSAILKEALNRKHQVVAIVRNPENITLKDENLTVKPGDVLNENNVAELIKGCDAVISAYNSGWGNPDIYNEFLKGSKSIQSGVKKAGIKRYIVIGGAGSLEVAPGVQAVDTPDFPAAIKPGATAARDYLNILKEEQELDWTYISPAFEMHQGTSGIRKGVYRLGLDNPVFDEEGRSVLSVEDLALAVIDELEKPKHIRKRFTAAY